MIKTLNLASVQTINMATTGVNSWSKYEDFNLTSESVPFMFSFLKGPPSYKNIYIYI